MKFTKMHGLGNDFIVFKAPLNLTSDHISKLCNRHTGIGADAILLISQEKDSIKMEYWNSDGSTAEMCGNGLRCAVRFATDNKMMKYGVNTISTGIGALKVRWNGVDHNKIEIQVGKAIVTPQPIKIYEKEFYIVDVGNPHAVMFVDDIMSAPVEILGQKIETHALFPYRTNVEFVEIVNRFHVKIRIWERGVGETLACGTGMVAVSAVTSQLNKTTSPLTVEVLGGEAKIWLDEEGYMCMSAPAEMVYEGEINGFDTIALKRKPFL